MVSIQRTLDFLISIHAPTRGATDAGIAADDIILISIHAPTRGATVMGPFSLCFLTNFNPRSYKRSD